MQSADRRYYKWINKESKRFARTGRYRKVQLMFIKHRIKEYLIKREFPWDDEVVQDHLLFCWYRDVKLSTIARMRKELFGCNLTPEQKRLRKEFKKKWVPFKVKQEIIINKQINKEKELAINNLRALAQV